MSDDLARLLSRRDGRLLAGPDAVASGGSPAILGRVTTPSAAPGTFFKLRPQLIAGGECEGCDATFVDGAAAEIPAYNLGPATLSAGDKVVARSVASRWVAGRRSGGGGDPPYACMCWDVETAPTTLSWSAYWEASTDFPDEASGYLTDPWGPAGWMYIGTATGTLTYSATSSYTAYDGTTPCPLGPGWLGDWTPYCIGRDYDDEEGVYVGDPYGVLVPACFNHCLPPLTRQDCSNVEEGDACRRLFLACSGFTDLTGLNEGRISILVTRPACPGPGAPAAVACGTELQLFEGDGDGFECDPFEYRVRFNFGNQRCTITVTA